MQRQRSTDIREFYIDVTRDEFYHQTDTQLLCSFALRLALTLAWHVHRQALAKVEGARITYKVLPHLPWRLKNMLPDVS